MLDKNGDLKLFWQLFKELEKQRASLSINGLYIQRRLFFPETADEIDTEQLVSAMTPDLKFRELEAHAKIGQEFTIDYRLNHKILVKIITLDISREITLKDRYAFVASDNPALAGQRGVVVDGILWHQEPQEISPDTLKADFERLEKIQDELVTPSNAHEPYPALNGFLHSGKRASGRLSSPRGYPDNQRFPA